MRRHGRRENYVELATGSLGRRLEVEKIGILEWTFLASRT